MRILKLGALVAILVIAVAACSSDSGNSTEGSPATAGSPLAAEPSTPAVETLGAASPAA